MTAVTISGWRNGLNKVQLNHVLQQHTGCGLGEAKRAVDQLLAGKALAFEFSNSESASDFRQSAEAVGAVCSCTVDELVTDCDRPSARR